MSKPPNLLHYSHSALDAVDLNDLDGPRSMWKAFSSAQAYIDHGERLANLSWRLYSRNIQAVHQKPSSTTASTGSTGSSASNSGSSGKQLGSLPFKDPDFATSRPFNPSDVPDLESSSSSESIQSIKLRKILSVELHQLLQHEPVFAGHHVPSKTPTPPEINDCLSPKSVPVVPDPADPIHTLGHATPSPSRSNRSLTAYNHDLTDSVSSMGDSVASTAVPTMVPSPVIPDLNTDRRSPDPPLPSSIHSAPVSEQIPVASASRPAPLASSVVRGFSPSSVSVAPSIGALRDQRAHTEAVASQSSSSIQRPGPAPVRGFPRSSSTISTAAPARNWPKVEVAREKMFFIAGSSDSDSESIEPDKLAEKRSRRNKAKLGASTSTTQLSDSSSNSSSRKSSLKSPAKPQQGSSVSTAPRPALRTHHSSPRTKLSVNFAVETSAPDEVDSDYESIANSDSEWDDYSEEEEDGGEGNRSEMFHERDVPLRPALRPSLLSSLFLNKQLERAQKEEAESAANSNSGSAVGSGANSAVPSAGPSLSNLGKLSNLTSALAGPSQPVAPPTAAAPAPSDEKPLFIEKPSGTNVPARTGSSTNSFLFQFAKRAAASQSVNSTSVGSAVVSVDALLAAPLVGHVPVQDPDEDTVAYSHDLEDVNSREMSQSVRDNLLQSRGFELESLWPKVSASVRRPTFPVVKTDSSSNSSATSSGGTSVNVSRRPSLTRSSTMPVRSVLPENDPSDDIYDAMNYHARGW